MSENIKNINEPQVEATEQALPAEVEIVGVNFREAGKIYYFSPDGLSLSVGEQVIVETPAELRWVPLRWLTKS